MDRKLIDFTCTARCMERIEMEPTMFAGILAAEKPKKSKKRRKSVRQYFRLQPSRSKMFEHACKVLGKTKQRAFEEMVDKIVEEAAHASA